jgi:plasmid stabilization system protein ParE
VPRLVFAARASRGIERCRRFLAERNKLAAERAARAIAYHLERLQEHPEIGRPFPDAPEMRELVIPFGDSGYVALYRYDRAKDSIVVLAFRHQREAGY